MTQMPRGVGYDWSGLSYEERQAGSNALALYALSLLFVFLLDLRTVFPEDDEQVFAALQALFVVL
jgi:hypothetical protein